METTKVSAAFVKAQKEFAPALKTSINPHFKSKYVGLDGCVEAVIDALNTNGIALMQKSHECDIGVAIETLFIHESGEVLSGGIMRIPANKQDAQGYGSALTYCRRYSLMAACGIAPEDDDGNSASKKSKELKHNQMQDHITAINDATSIEELQAAFKEAYKSAGLDNEWLEVVTNAKDAMKRKIK